MVGNLENSLEQKNLFYENLEQGLEFYYPKEWGEVVVDRKSVV